MTQARALVAGMVLVLAGWLTACGDSSSSSSSASKTDFCRTFNQLGADATPQHAADELSRVGTPSNIGASARRGFDVLVSHLRNLPPGATPEGISQMVKNLHTRDAADVRAFVVYYTSECQGIPGSSS